MFPVTPLTKLVGSSIRVVLAPMAGASTPELTAAVSNAGGLGAFAAAVLPPDAIHAGIARVRQLTSKPFSVRNLFILGRTIPIRGKWRTRWNCWPPSAKNSDCRPASL